MNQANLTRKDLAKAINEKMGFSQRSAADLVDAVFSRLKATLMAEQSVKLVHFGTFNVLRKSSRQGRNPRTGDPMEITRRSMISFRPSKILRGRINR
ncbi:MAG: integration host factor subunit alpha [Desulfobulbaceae bacterium]|nr:MAG: integration host factor subunit alpha [Desulfobulbaceae bacterium]